MGGQRLGLTAPGGSSTSTSGIDGDVIHNLMHRLWITLYHWLRAMYHYEWFNSSTIDHPVGLPPLSVVTWLRNQTLAGCAPPTISL
jgi:hypothetical protein